MTLVVMISYHTKNDSNQFMVASASETDRDLAATSFTKNCVAYNIIEF
jgi:hypothetical protein